MTISGLIDTAKEFNYSQNNISKRFTCIHYEKSNKKQKKKRN